MSWVYYKSGALDLCVGYVLARFLFYRLFNLLEATNYCVLSNVLYCCYCYLYTAASCGLKPIYCDINLLSIRCLPPMCDIVQSCIQVRRY